MRYLFVLSALCGSLALTRSAPAATWNEATQGDISGNRQSPSLLTLTPGSNLVTATTAGGDQEYLRLAVPAGGRIESIFLRSYASPDATAFIAIQAGTTFTEDPAAPDPGNLLGYSHFGPFNVNGNLLTAMNTPPLTGPNYTLWIQQLGASTAYTLDVVATPEPAGLAAVTLVTGFACLRRRRAARV
jgi:hypothetical protein